MKNSIVLTGIFLLTIHFLFGKYYPLLHVIPLLFFVAGVIFLGKRWFFIPKNSKHLIIIYLIIVFIGYFSAVTDTHNFLYPLRNAIRYFSYIIFFIYVYNSKMKSKHIIIIIITVLLFSALVFMYQLIWAHASRPSSIFAHANHYAYFLSFSSIILISNLKSRIKLTILLFVIGILLIATKSLGGFIVFIIGNYLIIHNNTNKLKLVLMILILLMLPIAIYFQSDRIQQLSDLKDLSEKIEQQNPGGGSSFRWRIVYWYMIINNTIKKGNVLFGNGLGTTSSNSPIAIDVIYTDPHNDYVRFFAETGLIGLMLYLYLYYFLIKYLSKYKVGRLHFCNKQFMNQYNGVYALVIALMLAQVSGNIIVSSAVIWLICAYLAIFMKKITVCYK